MTKYFPVYTLFCMLVFQTSCGQNQTNVPQDSVKSRKANYSESQLREADTSRVPMSMVRNVRKARNGDILVASFLAVFRYDGTSFINLTNKISQSRFSSFWDVLEDRKGNLWFASKDSGVYCYNGKSVQHFTTEEGLANNRVAKMYEDRAGNIWFATGGGASRYDGRSFRNFTTREGLSNDDLTTVMEDRTGRIWFGTRGEACFYDPRLRGGRGKAFTVLKNEDGKTFHNVWSIIEDSNGSIWLGDVDGLWRYDGSSFTKVSEAGAYAIIEDKKGNIWTSGEVKQGVWALSRYDVNTLYNKMPAVTEVKAGVQMDFLGMVEANDGSIWFGSGGGVHRYDGKTFTDFKSKDGKK